MTLVPYSVTCIPHFKPDTEKPWVTSESNVLMHYWFNPGKKQTLLEVAESIEAWALHEYEEEITQTKAYMDSTCCTCCIIVNYNEFHMTINKMDIRGVTYDHEAMATKSNDCLHNEEPIILRAEAHGGISMCTIL